MQGLLHNCMPSDGIGRASVVGNIAGLSAEAMPKGG